MEDLTVQQKSILDLIDSIREHNEQVLRIERAYVNIAPEFVESALDEIHEHSHAAMEALWQALGALSDAVYDRDSCLTPNQAEVLAEAVREVWLTGIAVGAI